MTTDNEARDLLKAIVIAVHNCGALNESNTIFEKARKFLADTEPAHPAVKAWWAFDQPPQSPMACFLAGAKWAYQDAAGMTCHHGEYTYGCNYCVPKQRILDAADKVPHD